MTGAAERTESEGDAPPAGGVTSTPSGSDPKTSQAPPEQQVTPPEGAGSASAAGSPLKAVRPNPLPFFIRFLVFYLLADVVLRVAAIVSVLSSDELAAKREIAWNSVLAIFHLVLVPQLLARSTAARISLSAVFAIQIGRFIIRFAFHDPSAWWEATEFQRVQWIGQIVFYGIAIAFLNSSLGSRALRK